MIDLKQLREHPQHFIDAACVKNITIDIDRLLEIDGVLLQLQQELEALQQERNILSKRQPPDIERGREVREMIRVKEDEMNLLKPEHQSLLLRVPNIPSAQSPIGDESHNTEIKRWGEPHQFVFPVKDHVELAKNLDLIDFERGVKIHGFRGYVLKNEAVRLQQAIMNYALDLMQARGFTLLAPPILVKEFALTGSGHFPFGKDEIFQIQEKNNDPNQQLYLAGTAEPSLLAFRADEMLDQSELPLRYCGISSCYRSEVGSYGKDTKGVYRIHEFTKVEQVIVCRDNLAEAEQWFAEIGDVAQELLQAFELPYRVLEIATGDMGAGKYRMQDIETWMPGRDAYGETHSNSLLTDWQSRRLNIKYKNDAGERVFPFTLNNTVVASPRILIALFENHQQPDGSIRIPKALVPYCGFDVIKARTN